MLRGSLALAVTIGALFLAVTTGFAEPKGKGKGAPKSAPPAKPVATESSPVKESAPSRTDPDTASSVAAPAMVGRGEAKSLAAKSPADAGATGVSVSGKDGGTKQFRFTETDVEGRLKAPQLVYFLRRVRAEFAAGDLGHRSFMRELSETQRDPNF
ncbi:MAG TPA: hypothetical protein VJT73_19615 [Polyangiaceae bacterium]|nr:hypothetical protein [Polyangiaceae bacterium]